MPVDTKAPAKVVKEEEVKIEEVKQASLTDCLAQLNKTRKAELDLKIAEEKAIAEARAKIYSTIK